MASVSDVASERPRLRAVPVLRVWLFYIAIALALVTVLVAIRASIDIYVATILEHPATKVLVTGQVIFALIWATAAACLTAVLRYVTPPPTREERVVGRLLALPCALLLIAWPAMALFWMLT